MENTVQTKEVNMEKAKTVKTKRKREAGFSVMDLLIWGGVVAVILGILGVASVYFTKWKEKQTVMSEFRIITTGLDSYYQNTYRYPSGTGWSWNTNNAFIPSEVVNKGWQYSCSGNTITITSPNIPDQKIIGQLITDFQSKCDNAGVQGNQIVCQLVNKPCP